MNAEEIEDYLSLTSKAVKANSEMDEPNTKAKILQPLIEDVLGWDFVADIELEYPVKSGSGKNKVDYAVISDNEPKIFVEAKSQRKGLNHHHREQLASYMKTENVDWGILSNGTEFQFLRRKIEAGNVSVELVEKVKRNKIDTIPDILETFSKQGGEDSLLDEQNTSEEKQPEWDAIAEAIYEEEGNHEEKIIGFYQGVAYDEYIELYSDKNLNGRRVGRADRVLRRHNKRSEKEIDALLFTTMGIDERCLDLVEKHDIDFVIAKRMGGIGGGNELRERFEGIDAEFLTLKDVTAEVEKLS